MESFNFGIKGLMDFEQKKLKETVSGGNIMMSVDVSSSIDGVERLLLLLVFNPLPALTY